MHPIMIIVLIQDLICIKSIYKIHEIENEREMPVDLVGKITFNNITFIPHTTYTHVVKVNYDNEYNLFALLSVNYSLM